MEFAAIFLEKTELQKYQLLQALSALEATGKTIVELSTKLALSYQRTYNLFQELSQDLATLTGQPLTTMHKQLLSPGPVAVSADHYLYDRLQNALPFRFFDYLVQGHQPSVAEFCQTHFISRSTLNRKLVALRQFLGQYQIKVSLTHPGFTGPEPQIRLCLQMLYWQAAHGTVWPFKVAQLADLQVQYRALSCRDPYPLLAQLDLFLLACSRLRIAQGHTLAGPPHAAVPIVAVFAAAQFPSLTRDQVTHENQFFAFYQATNLRLATHSPQPPVLPTWCPQAAQVTQYLQRHLLRPSDAGYVALQTDDDLGANIERVTARFLVLGGNYPKACDFSAPQHVTPRTRALGDHLVQFLQQLPETDHFALLRQNAASYAASLNFLLTPHLPATQPPATVHVKVLLAANDILNQQLSGFLDNLSIVTRMSDLAPLSEADLLICDAETSVTPPVARFIARHPNAMFSWYLDVTATDFHQLYLKLTKTYQDKLIPATP
ncbi:MAG: helix-turn-helix domain-containing protein [Lactobacillus sp.]|nr:helix-turn-helix domain-containing protein [Lactobacillus sp.]MCI2033225.1 helix-turn-helix domain-containing protein [Lactobacillus sp.]